ncbi:MAG: hypothetical protein HQL64_12075 [Magnetococcales bacterium]|nr:hypothetical protein [Magnetococcales bacterium]
MKGFEPNHFSVVIELVVGLMVTAVLLLLIGNVVVWGSRPSTPSTRLVPATIGQETPAQGSSSAPKTKTGYAPTTTGHVTKGAGDPLGAPPPPGALPKRTTPDETIAPSLPLKGDPTRSNMLQIPPPTPEEESTKATAPHDNPVKAARSDLLDRLETLFHAKNMVFESDRETGTLFLPELFQFSLGSAKLDSHKQDKIKTALDILADVVPCFVPESAAPVPCSGTVSPVKLRGIFIVGTSNHEGDQARRITNMTLAFGRASTAFATMVRLHPQLFSLLGSDGHGLFRVEAMSVKADQPEVLRRVVLRFSLAAPTKPTATK